MAWWEWLVGILLFIVALGILIGIHELGHLSAAKLFHVYCYNYSIGFGPALISSKRTEKRETIWTLRAIPLGGFVAMYGEGMQDDEAGYIPMSRSLEGVARYKRAIIVAAGVFLNFILGFVLIFIHNAAFDHVFFDTSYSPDRFSISIVVRSKVDGVNSDDALHLAVDPLARVNVGNGASTNLFLLDQDIEIEGQQYVLGMRNQITTTKVDPDLITSFSLFKAKPINEAIDSVISSGFSDNALKSVWLTNENLNRDEKKLTPEEKERRKEIDNEVARLAKSENKEERNNKYRAVLNEYYGHLNFTMTANTSEPFVVSNLTTISEVNIHLPFHHYDSANKKYDDVPYIHNTKLKVNAAKNGWNNLDIAYQRVIIRYNAGESFKYSWDEWCQANSTIFVALGRIFRGDISSIGGPIAIASMSTQTLANFGFERYLYMWGMISCNLAVINLLPFPGLDGWSLVVIGYEAITKRHIPTRAKGIISVLGLVLLFGLMFLILIKDVIGLIP